MLDLPSVTLIALTNKNIPDHEEAFKKSSEGIKWGARKLIVDLDCTSIDEWNRKVVFELHNYVQTEFALLIHADGYVINPSAWRESFLSFDFIGAPWPLPQDPVSYRSPDGVLQRVGNSVSIRSKKLMELPSKLGLEWRSYYGFSNEDGYLCCHHRRTLEAHGCKFAPLEEAVYFSKEHSLPENEGIDTFAFHSL